MFLNQFFKKDFIFEVCAVPNMSQYFFFRANADNLPEWRQSKPYLANFGFKY